jgi:hypothetical protein
LTKRGVGGKISLSIKKHQTSNKRRNKMLKDLWSGFLQFGYRCGDSQRTFVSESAIGSADGNTVSHYYALVKFKTGHCLPAPFFTEPQWFWLWAWLLPAFWQSRRESVAYLRQEVADKAAAAAARALAPELDIEYEGVYIYISE